MLHPHSSGVEANACRRSWLVKRPKIDIVAADRLHAIVARDGLGNKSFHHESCNPCVAAGKHLIGIITPQRVKHVGSIVSVRR